MRSGALRDGFPYVAAHVEMLAQISADFAALPDYRTMRLSEIRFFYRQLVPSLKRSTAPTQGGK